jgi:hypothetical protein
MVEHQATRLLSEYRVSQGKLEVGRNTVLGAYRRMKPKTIKIQKKKLKKSSQGEPALTGAGLSRQMGSTAIIHPIWFAVK